MKKAVEGFDRHLVLAGFAQVAVGDVTEFLDRIRAAVPKAEVQVFEAGRVAGWEHLYFATLNALKAFRNGTNISKSVAVECLLYAVAQSQITVALDLIGVKPSTSEIVVLIVTEDAASAERALAQLARLSLGTRQDAVMELAEAKVPRIRELFGITDVELAAVPSGGDRERALVDLVIEHMALLVTRR